MSRFSPFTVGELRALWDGMAVDDGIRYADDPESESGRVLVEIEQEMALRGMRPPVAFGSGDRSQPAWSHPELMGATDAG